MNELVVVKDVLLNAKIGGGLITGINEINQLANGALAIFTDKNEMLTAANVVATLPNKKGIYFALGSGDATLGAQISQIMDRESANVESTVYSAPVKQEISVGLDGVGSMNIATPLVAGTVAYLRIIDTVDTNINLIRAERYSYEVQTGDVAADVVAGIIAAANANTESKYTVTVIGVNTGFLVSANDFGQTFEVGLDGIISAATVQSDGSNSSTVVAFGNGTSTQVAELESEFSPEEGNTSRLWLANKYFTKASNVVTGALYDLWNIQWKQAHPTPIKTLPATDKQVIIALPNAPAVFVSATFDLIMSEAFGTASVNAEIGS